MHTTHTYTCVSYLLIIIAATHSLADTHTHMHAHTLVQWHSQLCALQHWLLFAFASLSSTIAKVYTACYFLCKLNKSWLFIRSDYGTWLSLAVKLKVKPAVAAIELHWVNNVKSKGSLTVIKRFSTALSSRRTALKLYFASRIVELHSSWPVAASLLSLSY